MSLTSIQRDQARYKGSAAPVKVGRTWYVDSDATYTPAPAAPAGEVVALSGRAAAIFMAAA